MTTKTKGRDRWHGATPKASASRHSNGNDDPLIGWHNLGKPAREQRRQKSGWQRKGGGR